MLSYHYIHNNKFDDDGQRHFFYIHKNFERSIMGGDLRGGIFLVFSYIITQTISMMMMGDVFTCVYVL